MIITRTPYRVSLFGGGTDYPAWFKQHGGQVLTTTLPKYTYISLRYMPPFLGSKYIVVWSKGMQKFETVDKIEHPGVRGCLQYLGIEDGIEVNHAGDLPARSGLGSSSAFTVGMLNALHALKGEYAGPAQLAHEAIQVEQNILKETVGIQDQIECAYGGLNHIKINPRGGYSVHPLLGNPDDLERHLMLFFTGLQRFASDIAEDQVKALKEDQLHAISGLVDTAIAEYQRGNLLEFGRILHESWMLKRQLSDKVSSDEIDNMYDRACAAGAIGGKLLGAGGGGFLLLFVPPIDQPRVRTALSDLLEVKPFKFGHEGSRVIHCDP